MPELEPEFINLCGTVKAYNDKELMDISKPREITCTHQPDPTKGQDWDMPNIKSILDPI